MDCSLSRFIFHDTLIYILNHNGYNINFKIFLFVLCVIFNILFFQEQEDSLFFCGENVKYPKQTKILFTDVEDDVTFIHITKD